jgi:hypothetical protein
MGGELRVSVAQGRGHVEADGIGPEVGLVHRVDHLRRQEHRHRRSLLLVALDVGEEVVREVVAERRLELLQVLHRVSALPLGGLPLLGRDVPIARESGPIRLLVGALEGVGEGLGGRLGVRVPVAGAPRLGDELHRHLGSSLIGRRFEKRDSAQSVRICRAYPKEVRSTPLITGRYPVGSSVNRGIG